MIGSGAPSASFHPIVGADRRLPCSEPDPQLRRFLWAGLFSVFSSPIMPLLDSTTLSILGARRDQYGAYRGWGTIGFVVTCTAVGFLIERTGMRLIFPVYGVRVLAFWLLALRLPNRQVVRGPSRLAGAEWRAGPPG